MDMQKLFSIRTGNERGQEFLAALRRLVESSPRYANQTDVVMDLVFEADAKLKKGRGVR